MAKRKLVFDHVPKTGGQSIAAALAAAFGEDGALPGISNAHHHAVGKAGSRRFVTGHLWFAPGEDLVPDWYYCTLLREPVDRFLSQYYFNRELAARLRAEEPEDRRLRDPQVLAAVRFELGEYLACTELDVIHSYTNVQAMHFAQRACANPWALSAADLFDAAVLSIQDYDLVGIYPDLSRFVGEIRAAFSLGAIDIPSLNVTSSRKRASDIPDEALEHLKSANDVDLRLLMWAREHFATKRAPRLRSLREVAVAGGGGPAADFGTGEIRLIAARCVGPYADPSEVHSGDSVRLILDCEAQIPERNLTIGIAICDSTGQTVLSTNTRLMTGITPISVSGAFQASFHVRANLAPGAYSLTVALHKGMTHTEGCYHWKEEAHHFAVTEPRRLGLPWITGFELSTEGNRGEP